MCRLLSSDIKKHTLLVLIAELKMEYYITYLIVTRVRTSECVLLIYIINAQGGTFFWHGISALNKVRR